MRKVNLLYLASLVVAVIGLLAVPSAGRAAYGDYISSVGTGGLNQPAKVAVSGDYVYVTDAGNKLVKRYAASSGAYDAGFSLSVSGTPVGIATNGTNIFVGDDTNDCVWIYNMSGALADLGGTGTSHKLGGAAGTALKMPNTVAISEASGHIFVVDGDSDKVYIYNSDGSANSSFGVSSSNVSSGTTINTYYPCGLAMGEVTGSTQYFYLGDQGNFRVQKLHYVFSGSAITTAPTYDQTIGSKGDAFGQFLRVSDLAWDANRSRLVVVDSLQMVGQLFDNAGATMTDALNWDGAAVEGNLNIPTGVAYSPLYGMAYVASNQSDEIVMYDLLEGIPPTVTADTPATPTTLSVCADNPIILNFTTEDLDSSAVTVYVFYDSDTSWSGGSKSLTPGSGEGSFGSWTGAPGAGNLPAEAIRLAPGTYYVRCVVVDDTGNSAEDYSAGTITIGDTDADGLNNIFEDCYGDLSPTTDDDVDGLNNLEEQANGCDPTNEDTDYIGSGVRGVIDGVEVAKGTDPTNAADDLTSTPDLFGWFYNFTVGEFNTRFTITNYSVDPAMIDISTFNVAAGTREGQFKALIPANGTYELDTSTLSGITDKGSIDVRGETASLVGIQHYTKLNATDNLTWDWMHMSEMAGYDMFKTTQRGAFFNARQEAGNHFITYLTAKNPTDSTITVNYTFTTITGATPVPKAVVVQPHRSAALSVGTVAGVPTVGYYTATSTAPFMGMENYFKQSEANLNVYEFSNAMLHEDGSNTGTSLYMNWYGKVGGNGGNNSLIVLNNPGATDATVTLTAYNMDGTPGGVKGSLLVPANNTKVFNPASYAEITATTGSIVLTSTQPVFGVSSVQYLNASDASVDLTSTANLISATGKKLVCADFNKVQPEFTTWLYITNYSASAVTATVDFYDQSGNLQSSTPVNLNGHGCAYIDVSDPTYNVTADRGSVVVTEPTGSILGTMCQSRVNPAGSTVDPGKRDAGEAVYMKVVE